MNLAHLRVLLVKDYLTLWRNKGFLIAFIVAPILLTNIFILIQNELMHVAGGLKSGSMIDEYFSFTTTKRDIDLKYEQKVVPSNFEDF